MFQLVCAEFVSEVGSKGSLIPSSSLDESSKLKVYNSAIKQTKRKWIIMKKSVYSATNFKLSKLLTDGKDIKSPIEETKLVTYTYKKTYSLKAKFGAEVADWLNVSGGAERDVEISADLGDIHRCQIEQDYDFIEELKERKLNLTHDLVQKIVEKEKYNLCVVTGTVQTTRDVTLECKYTTEANAKLEVKQIVHAEAGGAKTFLKQMTIPAGTVLAYKVLELQIDTKTGAITPDFMIQPLGFSVRTVAVAELSKRSKVHGEDLSVPTLDFEASIGDLKDSLQPIFDVTEATSLKSLIQDLMKCPSDVFELSKLLSEAEKGDFKENRDVWEKLFINKDNVLQLLQLTGVQIEEGYFVLEGETTPIFSAVSIIVDAMAELDTKHLEHLYDCSPQQLKVLSNIFERAISGALEITVVISDLEGSAFSLLTDLDFKLIQDESRIIPPASETCVMECMYCVLYCLCGTKRDQN